MFVPLVSYPRSGSTFLVTLIGQACNTSTMMEPFHQFEHVRLNAVRSLLSNLGIKMDDAGLAELVAVSKRAPLDFLTKLDCFVEDSILCFKVFPGHLGTESLFSVCVRASHVLFLYRNVVHAFISDEIASNSRVYAGVDTSEKLIEFDGDRFKRWLESRQQFMLGIQRHLEYTGSRFSVLHYEDFAIDRDHTQSLLEEAGMEYNVELILDNTTVTKQDKRRCATAKVYNSEAMLSVLSSLGLEALVDSSVSMSAFSARASVTGIL